MPPREDAMNPNETKSPERRPMGGSRGARVVVKALCAVPLALLVGAGAARAATNGGPGSLSAPPSLKTVPVPEPAALMNFVKDRKAAINLGKALFWDMQVGSDGVQACATCHFHAGADDRSKNVVSPGLNGGDTTFQAVGPNGSLSQDKFPFTLFPDPTDQTTAPIRDWAVAA